LHTITPTPTHSTPLSLHVALPICEAVLRHLKISRIDFVADRVPPTMHGRDACRSCTDKRIKHGISREGEHFDQSLSKFGGEGCGDRKSTRLNSSHVEISYAVFCLK